MSDFVQNLTKKTQYDSEPDEIKIQKIDINLIKPDEKQVRGIFDEDKIEELADSIKAKGLMNPIHVRLVDGGYIILTGERRYRACKLAGLDNISCIVHEEQLSENEIRFLQLIENLQRQNLSTLETARAFDNLMSEGMKKRQIAINLGISEATVSKYTSILSKMPDDWLKAIEETKKDVTLNDLYEIAKEANKTKKAMIYKKLLENLGKQVEMEAEEKEKEKEKESKEEKKKEGHCEFSEEELARAWDSLIKEKRKNIKNLTSYISSKKIQSLIEYKEE